MSRADTVSLFSGAEPMPRKSPISIGMLLGALLVGCSSEPTITRVPVATSSIALTSPGSTVQVGSTLQLQAVPMSASGKQLTARSSQVTWSSSNTTVASVSAGGLLTGLTAGQTTVTAAQGGASATASVTVNNPAPTVTSLSPTSVTAGDTAFNLRVLGSGFVSTSVVRWNGSDRTTTFVGSGEVRGRIAAADIASAGTFTVTVVNAAPGGGTSQGTTFTVNPATPVVKTTPATNVTASSADIHGEVAQDGKQYTVWFEWGTSPTLATYTASGQATAPSGNCPGTVTCVWTFTLAGLQPGTYYYRIAAQNAWGASKGAIVSFTITPPANVAPTISGLTAGTVQLNTCSNGGSNFTYQFNYSDPNGDVPSTGTAVSDTYAFTPSGASGVLPLTSWTRNGDGYSGTIVLTECIKFATDTGVSHSFTLTDAAGHVSNALALTTQKPAGANNLPGTPVVGGSVAPTPAAVAPAPAARAVRPSATIPTGQAR